MRTSRVVVAVAIAMLVAACTEGIGSDGRAAPDDMLLGATDGGHVVIDVGSSTLVREDTGSLSSPDGALLYAASRTGGSTTISSLEPRTGETLSSVDVRGDFEVTVSSVSGRAVALTEPLPPGVETGTPVPRAETTIVVADPEGRREERRYRLDGNFEPEAFSVDDEHLFLIQHLPAEAPAVYRVTTLDLADGSVRQVFGRFKTPPQRMPGLRLRQAFDPVRSQLYTLYSNEPGSYTETYERGEDEGDGGYWPEETFIHVLNLRQGWAYCAGLPRKLWGRSAEQQAIAPSPDGSLLYVVDSGIGLVSVMDTKTLEIVQRAYIDLGAVDGMRTSAQVSSDGATLYIASAEDGDAVYAIDTDSLERLHRWAVPGTISGLGLSSDGDRLYAAIGDGVEVLDATSGASLATVPSLGVDPIVQLAPLPA